MARPVAAVQLIVFGSRSQTDFASVLSEVAQAGFAAIEAGNLYETHGENMALRLLAENDLTVSGAHFGYGEYSSPEKLKSHVLYAKAVGVKHMMCSGVADSKTAEGYKQSAKLFNAVGRALAGEGIAFNYHNHAWEFDDLGGTNGMEILSRETDPDLVKFNIDVFWVWYGGQDPAAFIRKHADRAGYYHFKDGKRSSGQDGKPRPVFLELGRGDVDLRAAMAAARDTNPSYIVSEQDRTDLTPLEAVTVSRNYMREALDV
ncbi:MAG TPA: sugar phosphate isomerase/epimerase [Chthonomonadaceae bacterium]|nr:sugar phosphate isomerase/epimerase [Chthonomonadaceae bacterium]